MEARFVLPQLFVFVKLRLASFDEKLVFVYHLHIHHLFPLESTEMYLSSPFLSYYDYMNI